MIKNRPRSKQFVSVSKMRCLDEYDDGTFLRHATTVECCLSLKAKHLSCWTNMDFRILEIYFSMSSFHFDFPFKVFSGTDREAILRRFKVVTSDTLPPPAPEEVISS